MPNSAATRQCSSRTQAPRVASSSARPTKLSASGASPQSWTCSSVLGPGGAAATLWSTSSAAAGGEGARAASRPANHPSSKECASAVTRAARRPTARAPPRFVPLGQAARLEQHPHQRLEVLGAWVIAARLPVLDRAPVRAQAVRKLALGQASSPAVTQQQPAKRFSCLRGVHGHDRPTRGRCNHTPSTERSSATTKVWRPSGVADYRWPTQ